MSKRTAQTGLGSLATGAVTALAIAVQSGLAAVVGVIIGREFEPGAETDGFFAAYGVFVVLALAATAIRLVVLPPLARARVDRRLGQETAAWAVALGALALPVLVAGVAAARPVAALLTGLGPDEARDAAEGLLPLMVVAAVAQLYAGLAASALAALDDYLTAAVSYILGSVVGLAYIVFRIDPDGIDAVAKGMALNGAVAVALPTLALWLRARSAAMPRSAVRPSGPPIRERLLEAGRSAALPLALQAVFLICLPFAAREGGLGHELRLRLPRGVGARCGHLGVARAGDLGAARADRPRSTRCGAPRRVVLVARARHRRGDGGRVRGRGASLVGAVLGDSYLADVGEELGRLIALLSPWMVFAIGFTVTLPLLFVQGRTRGLLLVALVLVAVHVPLAWLGQVLAGLAGLCLALAVTTLLALVVMLNRLHAAAPTLSALARAAIGVGALACLAFGLPALGLGPGPAAAVGLGLYVAALALIRPAGLRGSWRYLRSLA